MAQHEIFHKGPGTWAEDEPIPDTRKETEPNNEFYTWVLILGDHGKNVMGQEHMELKGNVIVTTDGAQQLSGGLFSKPVQAYLIDHRYRMMKGLADIFIREKWARALTTAEIEMEIK